MRVVERDPHAEPIPFPGTQERSLAEVIEVGVFEDGQPVRVQLASRNTLIGGIVGSGKSGVVNVLLAILTACRDLVVIGIDLKGGMELRPWQSCLARLATTPEEAVTLLEDIMLLLDRRAQEMGQESRRLWAPTPDAPAVVVVVDEYAELPDEAMHYADSIARRGRAVAITLLIATQRPTQKAMGHSAVRSQMDVRICLRVRERRDVDLVLGQGMNAAGWFAETLNAPGKFVISSPEHDTPRRARAYYLSDEAVQHIAGANAPIRPMLPELSGSSAKPASIPRPREPRHDDASDPELKLWTALRNAPANGMSVGELRHVTGMSRPWVYRRLAVHADAGRVMRTERGRWRAVPSATDSAT
jgi:S-DNA-T family DNA segregation ATPase FtsK/SpoIIIE